MADVGRPKKPVDEKLLETLTKLHLNDKTIAAVLGVHVDTLHRNYADKMDEWKGQSKAKLAEVLFDEAINHREPYAIKMAAQRHLGYADKVIQETTSTNVNIELEDKVKIRAILKELESDV